MTPFGKRRLITGAQIGSVILGAGTWGMLVSALLIPFLARLGVPVLVASLLCIAAVGFPVTLWFIRSGDLELHIAPLALFLYGINILFVSTILQVVLILCGVRQIFGLHVDTWFWSWPSWMTNGE